jgi:hypothetical protein
VCCQDKSISHLTQEEIITLLNTLRPVGALALKFEETFFVIGGVEVCASEVVPVVLLRGVLVTSAREVEANPSFDLVWVGKRCVLVVLVDFDGLDLFFLVG